MKVLISGMGIAGPTLAWWLEHYGFEVTLIERSPALRANGYMIDFWGAGFDIAERMGLMEDLKKAGYVVRDVEAVDRSGNRVAGFKAAAFARIAHGRYISLPRGDLSAAIFHQMEDHVETMFGDSIESVHQTGAGVQVSFESGNTRQFDVVIGADGLHSRVRELVFGPEPQFERYLGYKAAAFHIAGYEPRKELDYVMYTQVGQQVARFSMRDGRTMFLFTFADRDPQLPGTRAEQETLLRVHFGNAGWECPRILAGLPNVDNLYFDRVSQIRMEGDGSWSRGRVALIGDAAFCVSLLAGQGSALAMVAAYILAGELHRAAGDYATAFAHYQALFGPFVAAKQKAALRFAGSFAPKSSISLFVRNRIMSLLRLPGIPDLVFGRDLADRIALPTY